MEFDDMRIIWDTQNAQPLYAIDERALHALVRRRGRNIARLVGVFEVMTILIMLVFGVAALSEPVIFGTDYHQIIGGGVSLAVAAYLAHGRRRRRQRDAGFDHSLRGDLDKAIAQVDYHIDRLRSFVWLFLVPLGIGVLISFALLYDSKPVWLWPATVASLLASWWAFRRDIRLRLPVKQDLEALRDTLRADEQP